MRRYVVALLLALGACGDPDVLAPPPTRLTAEGSDRPPDLPPTVVDLPLLIDLPTAVSIMEEELPRRFGDAERRRPVPGNRRARIAFEVRRSAFDVTMRGETFLIGATLEYQGRGWYDPPIGPEVTGACGTEGPRPRARIVIAIEPEVDSTWALVARPRVVRLAPLTATDRDRCVVTFLNIDVTRQVLDAAQSVLRRQLPAVAARLRSVDVKGEVEKVWREIQQPIHLADSVWLMLYPEGVRLGQLRGSRQRLGGTVGISARPRIETGARPVLVPRPLPPLDSAGSATGLNLLVEGRLDYDLLGAGLTDELAGSTVEIPGGSVEIRELGVFPIGEGRLALGVRFAGTARGQIFFVGTPRYDSATATVVVPDLDYDASTAPLLVQGVAWLKADQFRDFLRARAVFPATDVVERLSDLAVKGMNRELVPGVFLDASLDRTAILRLLPRADGLFLQGHATGNAVLHVTDGFFASIKAAAEDSGNGR